MKFRPGRLLSRLFVFLAKAGLGFLLLTYTLVILFRFVHPPLSMFMIYHKAALAGEAPRGLCIHYQWRDLKDISPFIPLAVMASEDQRFIDHFGFDFTGIFNAVKNNLRQPRRIRGASTLSQQTAKNLFLWPDRSYLRKGLEAYFTLLLELFWSKNRIMEMYLNIAEFGRGVYGVGAASRDFFNATPLTLTPVQATILAAVLPNPRKYSARDPSDFVYERSEWIEEQMQQMGGLPAVKAIMDQ
jgi:monofunctional biosynthetic peptidoglycan transglycosylase